MRVNTIESRRVSPRLVRHRGRRGFVLVVVLVCLSVIAALIFSALQTSLRQRKQLDRELQMEQTRLLAEAGLVHATGLVDQKENLIVIEPALHDKKHAEVKIETRQTLNTNVKVSSEE